MVNYRFMYDTGVSVVYPFTNDEMAKMFADSCGKNLMFYFKMEEAADAVPLWAPTRTE